MECCNTNMNMTLIIKTPREMLEQRFPDKYPWEAISGKKEFNYSQNKKQIEKKMSYVKHMFPVLCPVRILKQKTIFSKRSDMPPWSKEIYFVYRYKRPLLCEEPIMIKVIDFLGKVNTNVFHTYELKRIKLPTQDTPIVSKVLKKDQNNYFVNIQGYPKSLIFKIPINTFSNYKCIVSM